MIYILILLLLLLLISVYININMIRKYDLAEKYNIDLAKYIAYIDKTTNDMYAAIKLLDRRGSFEADDEVGYFFKTLKELIEELNKLTIDSTNKESV
jgi:hypothetical protein